MSSSPCYPEPYAWGSPVVPKSATGAYKQTWLALDAVHRARIYPATLLQCAGRTQKRDQWCVEDLDVAFTYVNAGLQWAPLLSIAFGQYTLSQVVVGNNQDFRFLPRRWQWLWWLHYRDSLPGKWFMSVTETLYTGTSTRLDTGEQHNYTAAPWANDVMIKRAMAASDLNSFGIADFGAAV